MNHNEVLIFSAYLREPGLYCNELQIARLTPNHRIRFRSHHMRNGPDESPSNKCHQFVVSLLAILAGHECDVPVQRRPNCKSQLFPNQSLSVTCQVTFLVRRPPSLFLYVVVISNAEKAGSTEGLRRSFATWILILWELESVFSIVT